MPSKCVRNTIVRLIVPSDNPNCDFLKNITSQQINEEKIGRARASQRCNGQKGIKPKLIHRRRIGR